MEGKEHPTPYSICVFHAAFEMSRKPHAKREEAWCLDWFGPKLPRSRHDNKSQAQRIREAYGKVDRQQSGWKEEFIVNVLRLYSEDLKGKKDAWKLEEGYGADLYQ